MKRLISLLLLVLNTNYCWALRCNGQLVYEGDKQKSVVTKCGDPQAKEILTTTQALYNSEGVKYGTTPFLTEVWTYHASPQDFVYKVYFKDKVVTSITAHLPSH